MRAAAHLKCEKTRTTRLTLNCALNAGETKFTSSESILMRIPSITLSVKPYLPELSLPSRWNHRVYD